MKYLSHLPLCLLFTMSFLPVLIPSPCFSQNNNIIGLKSVNNDSQFNVIKNDKITLNIGSLEIETVFIYREESAPYQGYLIKFKDFLRMDEFAKSFNSGNELLLETIVEEYENKLSQCQLSCDARIKVIALKNETLKKEIDKKEKELAKETKLKYMWTSISFFGGLSAGMLLNFLFIK